MKKTQFIELIQSIKATKVSFISIGLFVMLATGVFLGIEWASIGYGNSLDVTLEKWNMHDAEVSFVYGFSGEEIDRINNLDYVESAEGSVSTEATFVKNGRNYQAKIAMIPDKIDTIEQFEGTLPRKKGEVLVYTYSAENIDINIGDELVLIHDEKDDTYDLYNLMNEDLDALQEKEVSGDGMKYLTTDSFKVTGIGVCSTAIAHYKITFGVSSLTSIPNDCLLYTTEDNFDLKAFGGYQTLLVKGRGLNQFGTSTDEYKQAYSVFKNKLENDLKPYIDKKNKDVVNAVANLKQEINDKIADGEKQIADGEIEIADGLEKIADAEKQIADGKNELENGKKKLEDGQDELDDGWDKLNEGQRIFDIQRTNKQNVENAFKVLKALSNPYIYLYESVKPYLSDFDSILDNIQRFINNALISDVTIDSYNQTIADIETSLDGKSKQEFILKFNESANLIVDETTKNIVLSLVSATNNFFVGADEFINLNNNETKLFNLFKSQGADTLLNDEIVLNVNDNLSTYSIDVGTLLSPYITKDSVSESRRELMSNMGSINMIIYPTSNNVLDSFESIWETFTNSQKEIDDNKKKLEDGQDEIDDGWVEYYDGVEEIEKYEKDLAEGKLDLLDGQKQLAEGKQKIEDNKDKIKDFDEQTKNIKEFDITVLGRRFNAGVCSTDVPTDMMNNLKYTLALLFVVVGILVTYSALSRSVFDQTILIGTKKALGVGRKDINLNFIAYAGMATTIGSILGVLFARFIFEPIIMKVLSDNFEFAGLINYFSFKDSILFYVFELSVSLLVTMFACNKILKQKAIKLLAGKQELVGKQRFFEKSKLWNSLSLITKTIINNCLNDPRRVFATLVGITGCCSIMVCAATLLSNVDGSMNYQINTINKFDTLIYYNPDIENACIDIENTLNQNNIKNTDTFYSSYTLKDKDDYLSASIFIYDSPDFLDFFTLSKDEIPFNTKGLCLSKAYATSRNKKVGDILNFIDADGDECSLRINGIFDCYSLKAEMIVDKQTYESQLNKEINNSSIVLNRGNYSIDDLYELLNRTDGFVSIVDYRQDIKNLCNALRTPVFGLVSGFFALAVILAFLVLLNLLIMFVDEKKKELIVLMINGYSRKDAEKYIYKDTIVLTILGIICGVILGGTVGLITVKTFDSDTITLSRKIGVLGCLLCVSLTAILSAITCKMALRKIKQFKLTEINKA